MAKVKDLKRQVRRKSHWEIYTLLLISGILLAITSQYFIVEAQIYTPGLGGIAQGISYVVTDLVGYDNLHSLLSSSVDPIKTAQIVIYWPLYILMNIPTFYFMFRWYGVRFGARTIVVFATAFVLGQLLANLNVFNEIQVIPRVPEDAIAFEFLYFSRIILLAVIGSMIYGLSIGIALAYGGSTGGLDPVAKYISREKGIDISKVLFAIGLLISLIFITVRAWTNPANSEIDSFYSFMKLTFISPQMISTILFLLFYSKIAASFYSPTKKVKLSVTGKNVPAMSDYLIKNNYHRGHTLNEVVGGYSKNKFYELQMAINIEELGDMSQEIAKIDPNAMIIVTEIQRIYDLHDWTPRTEYDKMIEAKYKTSREKKSQPKKK